MRKTTRARRIVAAMPILLLLAGCTNGPGIVESPTPIPIPEATASPTQSPGNTEAPSGAVDGGTQTPDPEPEELTTDGFYDKCIERAASLEFVLPAERNYEVQPESDVLIYQRPDAVVVMAADTTMDNEDKTGQVESTLKCMAYGPVDDPSWLEVGLTQRMSDEEARAYFDKYPKDGKIN